jgi:hypothetical protein
MKICFTPCVAERTQIWWSTTYVYLCAQLDFKFFSHKMLLSCVAFPTPNLFSNCRHEHYEHLNIVKCVSLCNLPHYSTIMNEVSLFEYSSFLFLEILNLHCINIFYQFKWTKIILIKKTKIKINKVVSIKRPYLYQTKKIRLMKILIWFVLFNIRSHSLLSNCDAHKQISPYFSCVNGETHACQNTDLF